MVPAPTCRAASVGDASEGEVGEEVHEDEREEDGGPTHLYVLIHGYGGTQDDLLCLETQLLTRGGGDVLVLRPACNAKLKSFDGVPQGATRVADEIRAAVRANPSLTRISLVGNSLGGIYARYAAALLFERAPRSVCPDGPSRGVGDDRGTIAGLEPETYLTTATPHLGVGPFGHLGLIPRLVGVCVVRLLGRTARQLALFDGKDRRGRKGGNTSRPLLVEMADPSNGGAGWDERTDAGGSEAGTARLPYMEALGAFRRRCAYANAVNDFLVAYETAALDPDAGEHLKERKRKKMKLDGHTTPASSSRGGANVSVPSGAREAGHGEGTCGGRAETTQQTRTDRRDPSDGSERTTTDGNGSPFRRWFFSEDFARREWVSPRGRTRARVVDVRVREPRAWDEDLVHAWRDGHAAVRDGRERPELSWARVIAAGLQSLSWHHVDVEFPGVMPIAHNKICALARSAIMKWLFFADGEGVVAHQAEYLLACDARGGMNARAEESVHHSLTH